MQIYEEYSTKKIAKVGQRPVRAGKAKFFVKIYGEFLT